MNPVFHLRIYLTVSRCRVKNECTQFVMGFRLRCQIGAAGNGIYGASGQLGRLGW